MILIKCLVKIDQSLEKQNEKKKQKPKQKTKKQQTNKQTNKQKELTTTNEKLHENCRIVQKTDSTIDKTRMKKRNPIPIVHCAILREIHGKELSNCHTIKNQIARTVAW